LLNFALAVMLWAWSIDGDDVKVWSFSVGSSLHCWSLICINGSLIAFETVASECLKCLKLRRRIVPTLFLTMQFVLSDDLAQKPFLMSFSDKNIVIWAKWFQRFAVNICIDFLLAPIHLSIYRFIVEFLSFG
jgi:hypothetical protein